MGFCWDVVAVTAETAGQAHAFQAELQQRRELGSLPGVDTLYTGVAKRTPSGGYFTS